MDEIVDKECTLPFISEIELQVWNPPNNNDIKIYETFVSKSIKIGIQKSIILETIRIRKAYKIKLPDALIVATALVNNLTLIADNDKDFIGIPELKYVNPQRSV